MPPPADPQRDERVLRAREADESRASIAQRERISEKTVTEACKRAERNRDEGPNLAAVEVVSVNPMKVWAESLAVQGHAQERLLALAARTKNDAAKVGALKAAAQVADARLGTLERVGMLPEADRAWFAAELDWAALWRAVATAAEKAGVPLDDIQGEFDELKRAGQEPPVQLDVVGFGPEPGRLAA